MKDKILKFFLVLSFLRPQRKLFVYRCVCVCVCVCVCARMRVCAHPWHMYVCVSMCVCVMEPGH